MLAGCFSSGGSFGPTRVLSQEFSAWVPFRSRAASGHCKARRRTNWAFMIPLSRIPGCLLRDGLRGNYVANP